jgi:ring-1,2-phenylacetyl-CoA epoxidase subunit PaaE
LVLHHVFSDEPTDVPLNMGVMNREKLGDFLRSVVPAASIDHAFVCGPFQMNDEAEAALRAAGVPEASIHIERFGVAPTAGGAAAGVGGAAVSVQASAVSGGADAVLHQILPGDAAESRVTIVRDGLRREINVTQAYPSVLDAASAQGLEVPFSCTSGVCGTCRCKVIEGEVRMDRNFALDAKEVAAGFVLSCQARPLTPRVVLSFDER